MPLIGLIQRVYGLRDFQIVGGPKWLKTWASSRFTVEAQAEGATEDELRSMAQGLLAERFKLKVHRETRLLPVYALIAAPKGVHVELSKIGTNPRGAGRINHAAPGVLRGKNVMVSELVRALSEDIGRPVIDRSGLTEPFDFNLEWRPEPGTIRDVAVPGDDPRASLFSAIEEQLGMQLKATKDTIEVLVIDHVERPSDN